MLVGIDYYRAESVPYPGGNLIHTTGLIGTETFFFLIKLEILNEYSWLVFRP